MCPRFFIVSTGIFTLLKIIQPINKNGQESCISNAIHTYFAKRPRLEFENRHRFNVEMDIITYSFEYAGIATEGEEMVFTISWTAFTYSVDLDRCVQGTCLMQVNFLELIHQNTVGVIADARGAYPGTWAVDEVLVIEVNLRRGSIR